jgi:hypothetical protein
MDVLAKIADEPGDTPVAAGLADPFMFQDYYGDRTPEQEQVPGPDFMEGAVPTPPGKWQGPIESGYGWHLVWIDSITPAAHLIRRRYVFAG